MNDLVSVIIPCYNQAQFLPDALESVLAQTHCNWECIIVNDGSPDNTEEVALIWCERDPRFLYFKKENGGLSSARNAGLRLAKGAYIQFLDADDTIHPDKFALQLLALRDCGPIALSISDYFPSVEDDLYERFLGWYASPAFQSNNYLGELISRWEIDLSIPIHCFLFASNLFSHGQIKFNETLPNHEDWECWMQIFKCEPDVIYIDQALATYRIRNYSMTSDINLMREGFLSAIKIQKKRFKMGSNERILLDKKFNLIRFGINESNILIVAYKKFLIRLKSMVKKAIKDKI